jgi:DNA-binding transcriptional ArsR family regulator
MDQLQDFIISRVRRSIVELFFQNPGQMWYVREISRQTKEEINAVRRELDRLTGCNLLKSEERGNRLYYSLNKYYPFYAELLRMVMKSTGLGAKLYKYRSHLGKVRFIMFSGKFVQVDQSKRTEVDILVVGDIVLAELEALIKEEEKNRGREISYTVLSQDEFEFRKQRRDPFLMEVLYGTRVMIVGNEEELVERKLPGIAT